jgi:hypothetical protein
MYSVTYAVTFKKKFFYQGIYYYPGVEYFFTTLSDSDHHMDVFDEAYSDHHIRFGELDYEGNIVVENIKPLSAEPIIKEVKEVTL